LKKLLNIVGNNKGWAVPNRAKNLSVYLKEYFEIATYFDWNLPRDFSKFDVIHMHHPVLSDQVNLISCIWGFELTSERVLPKVEKFELFKKAHFVIAKNSKLFDLAHGRCRKLFYIPNGVDTKLFMPLVFRVGWVGNDSSSAAYAELKGTNLIKKACDLLNSDLKGVARVEFVRDPSRYPKIFSQEDVAKFYRSLDVFVLASKSEGSSNVVLEALSIGIPVVTTKIGNWDEFVNSDLVVLVERDIESIKEGIKQVLNKKIQRRYIMIKKFDWSVQAEKYISLYKEVGVL